jgi:hypothetical protein
MKCLQVVHTVSASDEDGLSTICSVIT